MVFPGHIAAGYLVTYGLIHLTGLPLTGNEQILLLGIGALLGDAPDIDIFFSFLKKKSTQPTALVGHRDHLTHMPVLWLALGLLVYILSSTPSMQTLGLLLWLCPWAHLLGDSIFTNTGVRWFWPFSKERSYLSQREDKVFTSWKDLLVGYMSNPLFYIEVLLTLIAILVLIR